jgi:hypothetical protein
VDPFYAPPSEIPLFEALFAVQQELDGVTKDSKNPFFRSTYADRTTILQTIKPLFAKHGLLLIQAPTTIPMNEYSFGSIRESGKDKDGDPCSTDTPIFPLALKTTIIHVATGRFIEGTAVVPCPNPDPQGYASALTYTSRISLTAMLGLPLLDDDGNGASPLTTKKAPGKPAQTKVEKKPDPTPAAAQTGTAEGSTPATPATATGAATPTTEAPKPAATKGRKLWGGAK